MKPLEGIRLELLDELQQTSDKYTAQIDEIRKAKDALLERAGHARGRVFLAFSRYLVPIAVTYGRWCLMCPIGNCVGRWRKLTRSFTNSGITGTRDTIPNWHLSEKLRDDRCKLPDLKISQIRLAPCHLLFYASPICLTAPWSRLSRAPPLSFCSFLRSPL